MSNAPDKIWACPDWHHDWDSGSWDLAKDNQGQEAEYLLSTPAREHADELVEALRGLVDPFIGCISAENVHAACNLLAKIKEVRNE